MSVEENKNLVRRCIDQGFNKQNIAVIEEFFAPDIIPHPLPPTVPHDREGFKRFFSMLLSAFPDYHLAIEDMIAEGDKVVIRSALSGTHKGEFMEIAPTDKRITWTGIEIWRIEKEKVVEIWGELNMMAMMQQLGAGPTPTH